MLQEAINAPIPNIVDQYLFSTPHPPPFQQHQNPRDSTSTVTRNELAINSKRTPAAARSPFFDAGFRHPSYKQDGNAWHFMSLPTGIAMSDNGNFATSNGVYDANHDGGSPFTGPTLWSSDMSIYAEPSGGNGSHLDMLHESPYCQGIASETLNRFWVVDGNLGDIVMYDFKADHGPGIMTTRTGWCIASTRSPSP